MKNKPILTAVISLGILIIAALLYSLPVRPFISKNDDISIIELHVNEYDFSLHSYFETPILLGDSYALSQAVKRIQCNRIDTGLGPYEESQVKYKIYCVCNQKSVYILLGELNIIYTPGTSVLNHRSYRIANADEILAEVDHLVGNTRQ